jgi:hypothetical protein
MMNRTPIVAIVTGFGLGGLVGAFVYFGWSLPGVSRPLTTPVHPVWAEVQWPFPADEWGKGKAFRCGAADCGVEVDFYIRAKMGFCNCTTGVSDDDELARLSDFSLMGGKPVMLEPGHPIGVAWMKGRSRSYAIADSYRARRSALAVAFNDHCDAVVATVVIAHDRPAAIEPSVIAFLNGQTVMHWAEVTLGL